MLGLIITVVVVAVGSHEIAVGIKLLDEVAVAAPTVTKTGADQGFKKSVVEHGAGLGIDVESVERNPADAGFVVQPTRWRVEQTFGISMDTGTEPSRIETMRAKLKRLVATGLVTEHEPGLFAIPRPRTGD